MVVKDLVVLKVLVLNLKDAEEFNVVDWVVVEVVCLVDEMVVIKASEVLIVKIFELEGCCVDLVVIE